MYFHSDGHHVNINGVGNHKINDWHLVTFCAVIEADLNGMICLVLGIFHNYVYVLEQVSTIHSNIQLRTYGNLVCDQPVGNGRQCNPVLFHLTDIQSLFVSVLDFPISSNISLLTNK